MATRRYTNRRTVSRELSDAAKIAKMEAFIGKEVTAKLVETYGPYAYDIYRKALAGPAYLMPYSADGKYRSSAETLRHFADHEISNEQLARLFNTTAMAVEAKKASYRAEQNQSEAATAEIPAAPRTEQNQSEVVTTARSTESPQSSATPKSSFRISLSGRENTFNRGVDNSKKLTNPVSTQTKEDGNTAAAPTQVKEGENTATAPASTPSQETTQPAVRDPSQMTLDDYVRNYPAGTGPLKGQAFLDAAYEDFGKGEGVSEKIYVEVANDGNPTIGKGNLILPKVLLDPNASADRKKRAGTLSGYRQRFEQMELTKVVGGKTVPLSIAEKDKIFNDLVNAVKNHTLRTRNEGGYNIIVSPASAAQVRMSSASMRKQFDKDIGSKLEKCYEGLGKGNKTKGQEIFNKYPRDLQLALAHAYYAGNPGLNISNAIKAGKVNPEDLADIITKLAQERPIGNDQILDKIGQLNPEFDEAEQRKLKAKYNAGRNSSTSRNAPMHDARKLEAGVDTVLVAQNKYTDITVEKKPYNIAINTIVGRDL